VTLSGAVSHRSLRPSTALERLTTDSQRSGLKSAREIDPTKIIVPHGKLIKELIKRNLAQNQEGRNIDGPHASEKKQSN
jgi:hypothetical protein